MIFQHFTCEDGHRGIIRDGMIRPNRHPLLGGPSVIWLTREKFPKRAALGLTSHSLSCDRMAHRIEVDPDHALHWDAAKGMFNPIAVQQLESARGARPSSWWVTFEAIPITSGSV